MREAQAALAAVGEQLLAIRDTARYRADGFESFDDYCAVRVPELVRGLSWNLSPARVAEFVAAAIVAAERKREAARARGVSGE
jgi:hypothetical protein